jgi:hypothetical protein
VGNALALSIMSMAMVGPLALPILDGALWLSQINQPST